MEDVINQFIQNKSVGLVGASRNPDKWGHMLFKALRKKGYQVLPVNPNTPEVMGEKCYARVSELPQDIENVILAVPPRITDQVVKECSATGIKRVWMHKGGGQGAQTEEAIKYCKDNGMDVVYGLCPMMFMPPTGFHRVHFLFKKLFGTLPADYEDQSG